MVNKERFLTDTQVKIINFLKEYSSNKGYDNIVVKSKYIDKTDLPLKDGKTIICVFPIPSTKNIFTPIDFESHDDVYTQISFDLELITDLDNQIFLNDLYSQLYYLFSVDDNKLIEEGIYTKGIEFPTDIEPDENNIIRISCWLNVIV